MSTQSSSLREHRGPLLRTRSPRLAREFTLDQAFYDQLSEALGERLKACSGVPVVTATLAMCLLTALANRTWIHRSLRGLVCCGCCCKELQIWKEVTASSLPIPAKCLLLVSSLPSPPRKLPSSPTTAARSSTRHQEQAIKKAIPIRIKNVENPTGMGTVIFPDVPEGHDGSETSSSTVTSTNLVRRSRLRSQVELLRLGSSSKTEASRPVIGERKLPTAVTIKDNVLVLNVHSNRKTVSQASSLKSSHARQVRCRRRPHLHLRGARLHGHGSGTSTENRSKRSRRTCRRWDRERVARHGHSQLGRQAHEEHGRCSGQDVSPCCEATSTSR